MMIKRLFLLVCILFIFLSYVILVDMEAIESELDNYITKHEETMVSRATIVINNEEVIYSMSACRC